LPLEPENEARGGEEPKKAEKSKEKVIHVVLDVFLGKKGLAPKDKPRYKIGRETKKGLKGGPWVIEHGTTGD